MAKKDAKTKIVYDSEEDILHLSRGRKVQASIEIGDFIVDVDTKGFISGIEILDASERLGIPLDYLKNISEASMAVTYKPNLVYLRVVFAFGGVAERPIVSIPIQLDLGHGSASVEEAEVFNAV